ncbi:DUF4870 domain-containing protein, partial [Verrucomicrobiales bacterium]|nr:DUF4870 domain-containing protein [Verrucomicrobiales bacterium]
SHGADLRSWSMWLHFSALSSYLFTATPLVGLVAPIVIWQMKKDIMPGIEVHGKNAINFHLSLLAYTFILGIIGTVFILVTFGLGAFLVGPLGALALAVLGIVGLVFPILAGVEANKGRVYKYPLTIDFFKLFAKDQQSGS